MSKIIVVHSITENKLQKAIQLGGLPLPSIAVMKPDNAFDTFGEITFIIKPEVVDPKDKKNLFFDRDIFSQRIPELYYDVNKKELDIFYKKIESYLKTNPEFQELFSMYDYDSLRRKPSEYIQDRIKMDNVVKMMFLESIDKDYKPPYKKAKLESDLSSDIEFQTYLISRRNSLEYDSEFKRELHNVIERRHSLYKDTIGSTIANDIRHLYENSIFDANGNINTHSKELEKTINDLSIYADNRLALDTETLSQHLNDFIYKHKIQYDNFIDSMTNDIFFNPHLRNGTRKVEYTLQNIEKFMLRQKVMAAEDLPDTNVGKISSTYAKQFKSFSEMVDASYGLDTVEDREDSKSLINRQIFDLTEKLYPYFNTFRKSDIQECFCLSLASIHSEEAFVLKLKRNGFDVDDIPKHLISEGLHLIDSIKMINNHYFEGKPQKTLNFSDFKAVVVPEHLNPELMSFLKSKMSVHTYTELTDKNSIYHQYSFDSVPKKTTKLNNFKL